MATRKVQHFRTASPVIATQIRLSVDAHSVLMQLVEKNRRTIKAQIEQIILDAGKREGVKPETL